ncbi:MAG: phage adaptor protein [Bacillota bacterium]
MNFGDIQSRVADYLNRTDLSDKIKDAINIAQRKLERQYNFNYMQVRATASTSDAYITVPMGYYVGATFISAPYKELIHFKVKSGDTYYSLIREDERIVMKDNKTGLPEYFCHLPNQKEFLVYPAPDKEYSFDLLIYRYSPTLTETTDTNYLTDYASEILIYGALCELEPILMNDERIVLWKSLFKEALEGLRTAEKKEVSSGSIILPKSNFTV